MLLTSPANLGQRVLVVGLALVYALLLQYAYSSTDGLWAYLGYRVSPLGPE